MELTEEALQRIITESITAALQAVAPPAPAPTDEGEAVLPSGIMSARQFYNDYLCEVFARDPNRGANNWCSSWFEHLEARIVVEALWKSWEVLRQDPDMGMAVWMRDYAYPLMSRLFDETGTFCACNTDAEGHNPDGVVALPH